MSTADHVSRRSFLARAAGSIGLVLSAPAIASIVASCELDETVQGAGQTYTLDISTVPELATVGSITALSISTLNGGAPVFISRVATDAFAVFTTVCTHEGCTVETPQNATDDCLCPCHLSVYSRTNGKVIQQPTVGSSTDLPTFPATFNAATNILTITG